MWKNINIVPISAAFALLTGVQVVSSAEVANYSLARFAEIYEPSGVAQRKNGDIIVIEDEPDAPLWVFRLRKTGHDMVLERKDKIVLLSQYDDLEGIAVGRADDIFLVTSHSPTAKGKRKGEREQLLRLDLNRTPVFEEAVSGLIGPLVQQLGYGLGQQDLLNIEGLTFDGDKERLLFGLRDPLVNHHSAILTLNNPYACLAEGKSPDFDVQPVWLDIGGGVRAICYDHLSPGYIIANEINEGGRKIAALWRWHGGIEVERLTMAGLDQLSNIEGLAVTTWEEKDYLLLVCDDGSRAKDRGGHYLITEYRQLRAYEKP